METFSIVFVTLFMIFTISEVSCNNDDHGYCHSLNDKCLNNRDCCTQKCDRSFYKLNKYCRESFDFMSVARYMVMPRVEDWMCLYRKSNNTNESAEMNKKFGLNVGYAKLPAGTQVKVTYSDKTLLLTINDEDSLDSSGEVLHLSNDVANEFGIEFDGPVPCVVVVPTLSHLKDNFKSLLFNLPFGFGRLVSGLLWLMVKL